ncbi:hypothetical protein PHYPSEUDO_012212 [Phytophthora pseudosyringae]|uniref:Uncharacterized protein n=1 Tax=Phytophthora pseudosyringae TaxID=221518 RepID=A0A8T1W5B0_9STRA|nr:hypothetical protein PHYPSEUDO_012212 [Phytophthora pseudosyringae]
MVPHLVFNAERGVDALLKHWLCVSLRFEHVEVELDGMKKGPASSLFAITSSVISTTDTLTPMLQLCGSVEDVSRVFESALISPNFQWRARAWARSLFLG